MIAKDMKRGDIISVRLGKDCDVFAVVCIPEVLPFVILTNRCCPPLPLQRAASLYRRL